MAATAPQELAPGLLWWQARHPEWPGDGAGWGPEVSSYAVVDGETPILFDPLAPPDEVAASESVVILTCAWHRRDAAASTAAGADLYAPDELEHPDGMRPYQAGDTLHGGIEAHAAFFPGDHAIWVPSHRALVFGESLYGVDGAARLPPPEWLPDGATVDDVRAALAPLVDLEPEWFLPTHGEPLPRATDRLRAALR